MHHSISADIDQFLLANRISEFENIYSINLVFADDCNYVPRELFNMTHMVYIFFRISGGEHSALNNVEKRYRINMRRNNFFRIMNKSHMSSYIEHMRKYFNGREWR